MKKDETKEAKTMRFNQIFINYLIKSTGETDSSKWLNTSHDIKTKVIKGNNAIVPKGTN